MDKTEFWPKFVSFHGPHDTVRNVNWCNQERQFAYLSKLQILWCKIPLLNDYPTNMLICKVWRHFIARLFDLRKRLETTQWRHVK